MHPNDPNWHSPVEAARVVVDAGEIEWDAEADFVVVGYGIAGAAAAVEARERGLDVLVVDRSTGGGASAMSGGVLYAGGGTRIQREAGVEDSPPNMWTSGSRSQSALQIPTIIPQLIWIIGLLLFVLVGATLFLDALAKLKRGDRADIGRTIGIRSAEEDVEEEIAALRRRQRVENA